MLVGKAGRVLGVVDAGGSARVDVTNVVGVLCLELIELVGAVLDGIDLAVYPPLASEGVDVAPETFLGLAGERLSGGVGRGIGWVGLGVCRLRAGLGCGRLGEGCATPLVVPVCAIAEAAKDAPRTRIESCLTFPDVMSFTPRFYFRFLLPL